MLNFLAQRLGLACNYLPTQRTQQSSLTSIDIDISALHDGSTGVPRSNSFSYRPISTMAEIQEQFDFNSPADMPFLNEVDNINCISGDANAPPRLSSPDIYSDWDKTPGNDRDILSNYLQVDFGHTNTETFKSSSTYDSTDDGMASSRLLGSNDTSSSQPASELPLQIDRVSFR